MPVPMTDCITKEKIQELKAILSGAESVAVAAHTHPDGDALGAVTALALYLQRFMGKTVTCYLPDRAPENLNFILNPAVSYKWNPQQSIESDAIVLLDCNAFIRTEGLGAALQNSKAPKVLIDHHLNPDSASFNLVFSTPDISSASELLFHVLKALGWDVKDTEIGTALLSGMTTDTNNFSNSTYPSTFEMASELIAGGVDRDAVLTKIYQSYRENRIRIIGYMQYQGLKVYPEGAACMIITNEIKERFGVREGETEGLVNMPLAIENVKISLLLTEQEGHFRVSLRSKKGTSAQQCAQRFFNGGGHENAAGGKLFPERDLKGETIEEYARKALLEVLK